MFDELKSKLLSCGNALLAVALEIESSGSYLTSTSDQELEHQIRTLELRMRPSQERAIQAELKRSVEHKQSLLAERRQLAESIEVLRLRLDSIVDAIDLTHGKVLQLAASPAFSDEQATTQVAVYVDALIAEVAHVGQTVSELETL